MPIRLIFAVFVIFALLGDARIFLFVLNRVVFGSHRQERSPWHFLMYIVPPVLLLLTGLFWIVPRWLDRPHEAPELAAIGTAWLIIAAAVGMSWVLDRVRVHSAPWRAQRRLRHRGHSTRNLHRRCCGRPGRLSHRLSDRHPRRIV